MLLHQWTTGDEIHRYKKSIVVKFVEPRRVLSTSQINGGYREDLKSVFNFDSTPDEDNHYGMNAENYVEEMKLVARELGLDPEKTTGISTTVSMDHVSIKTSTYKELTVTAVVTAGIEVNGGRVGDPASFYEHNGETAMVNEGTINIILSINGDLLPGTLARAMVTCTEAKTAALQELMARSMYSRGLATGSGTDETIVICNRDGKNPMTFAGKHSKLGELIGITVKSAVKEALDRHTDLNPKRQHSVFNRLSRFGVIKEAVWVQYHTTEKGEQYANREEFMERLDEKARAPEIVTLVSLYAHLIDQLDWGLLSIDEVLRAGRGILDTLKEQYSVECDFSFNENTVDEVVSSMAESVIQLLAKMM